MFNFSIFNVQEGQENYNFCHKFGSLKVKGVMAHDSASRPTVQSLGSLQQASLDMTQCPLNVSLNPLCRMLQQTSLDMDQCPPIAALSPLCRVLQQA